MNIADAFFDDIACTLTIQGRAGPFFEAKYTAVLDVKIGKARLELFLSRGQRFERARNVFLAPVLRLHLTRFMARRVASLASRH
jgi:hypothetical protein